MVDCETLFKMSYGMYIIAARKGNEINGCIVNTVFQVTPEPPMIAVSLNKDNLTTEYIMSSRNFAISILAEEAPIEFINRFGFRTGRNFNKFEGINHRNAQTGAPIILDYTTAFVEAELRDSIEVVTHTILIAEVVNCETLDNTKPVMTYEYYRNVKNGRTPRTAATYLPESAAKTADKRMTTVKKEQQQTKGAGTMTKYRCTLCGYIYDPQKGDPSNGVAPGTAFENLPADWTCPDCGAPKDQFEPI